jgi:CBS domain-containing protein
MTRDLRCRNALRRSMAQAAGSIAGDLMSTPASLNACAAFYAAQHGAPGGPSPFAGVRPAPRATAADLCSRDVATCGPDATVSDAARLMRHRHVGAIVVVEQSESDGPQMAGIVTHGDITTAIAAGDEVHSLRVADIMTRDVVSARAADPAQNVLAVMHRERIRRVPVIGRDEELLGMVTIEDVVATLGAQLQALADAVAAVRPQHA